VAFLHVPFACMMTGPFYPPVFSVAVSIALMIL
jgi:hypothetical protein